MVEPLRRGARDFYEFLQFVTAPNAVEEMKAHMEGYIAARDTLDQAQAALEEREQSFVRREQAANDALRQSTEIKAKADAREKAMDAQEARLAEEKKMLERRQQHLNSMEEQLKKGEKHLRDAVTGLDRREDAIRVSETNLARDRESLKQDKVALEAKYSKLAELIR